MRTGENTVQVPIKSIMLLILIIVISIVIMIIYSLFFVSLSVNNYFFQSGATEAYQVRLSNFRLNIGYTEQFSIIHT